MIHYLLRAILTVIVDILIVFALVYAISFWPIGSDDLQGQSRMSAAVAVSAMASVFLGLINGLILGLTPTKRIDRFVKVAFLCIGTSFFSALCLAVLIILFRGVSTIWFIAATSVYFFIVCSVANAFTFFVANKSIPKAA